MTLLITGATGFVGAHLLSAARGGEDVVRVLVRDADDVDGSDIEVVEGDMGERVDLDRALDGVDCAFYLVHSMGSDDDDFAERDRTFAETFVAAARAAAVRRIVYLGGVRPDAEDSEHLESRGEVEDILAAGADEFVALRASLVIGSGSIGFRALAGMVDRLAVLPLPLWRSNRTRPVAIADVVGALLAARSTPAGRHEIGGRDELSFEEMVTCVGRLLGEERPVVGLPLTSGGLEAAAASVVTGTDRDVLAPIMRGMSGDLTVEGEYLHDVYGVAPTPFVDAARDALAGMADDGDLTHDVAPA